VGFSEGGVEMGSKEESVLQFLQQFLNSGRRKATRRKNWKKERANGSCQTTA